MTPAPTGIAQVPALCIVSADDGHRHRMDADTGRVARDPAGHNCVGVAGARRVRDLGLHREPELRTGRVASGLDRLDVVRRKRRRGRQGHHPALPRRHHPEPGGAAEVLAGAARGGSLPARQQTRHDTVDRHARAARPADDIAGRRLQHRGGPALRRWARLRRATGARSAFLAGRALHGAHRAPPDHHVARGPGRRLEPAADHADGARLRAHGRLGGRAEGAGPARAGRRPDQGQPHRVHAQRHRAEHRHPVPDDDHGVRRRLPDAGGDSVGRSRHPGAEAWQRPVIARLHGRSRAVRPAAVRRLAGDRPHRHAEWPGHLSQHPGQRAAAPPVVPAPRGDHAARGHRAVAPCRGRPGGVRRRAAGLRHQRAADLSRRLGYRRRDGRLEERARAASRGPVPGPADARADLQAVHRVPDRGRRLGEARRHDRAATRRPAGSRPCSTSCRRCPSRSSR